jgi:hypothetical protein
MAIYEILITRENVYINGKFHSFNARMDKDNKDDDLNKKVLLALAHDMGYEPQGLFEEMADRLEEILHENTFYCVCGIGYNKDDKITDYEKYYGNFDNYDDAYTLFVNLRTKSVASFFEDAPEDVYKILVQLEECEETDDDITCIDTKNEFTVVHIDKILFD